MKNKIIFHGEVPFLEFAVESNVGRKRFPSHLQIFCSRASRANEVIFFHLRWTSPCGSKAASGVSNISYLDFSFHLKLVDGYVSRCPSISFCKTAEDRKWRKHCQRHMNLRAERFLGQWGPRVTY